MLQQTTVATVGPRFARFLARFPDLPALAEAPWEDVAAEWAGLGYYARARNLHAAARQILTLGGFPETREGLATLPGIGPYTAAAIAAIAFNAPVVPLDGNVERVTARVFAVEEALPTAKPRLDALAQGFWPIRPPAPDLVILRKRCLIWGRGFARPASPPARSVLGGAHVRHRSLV